MKDRRFKPIQYVKKAFQLENKNHTSRKSFKRVVRLFSAISI